MKLVTYKNPASNKPPPFAHVFYGYGEGHIPVGVGWWDDKLQEWRKEGGPQSQWYDGTIAIKREPDWWYASPKPETYEHTRGQWALLPEALEDGRFIIHVPDHRHDVHPYSYHKIADVDGQMLGRDGFSEEGLANAKLIAAAPSLAEALKNLCDCVRDHGVLAQVSTDYDEALAALREAGIE